MNPSFFRRWLGIVFLVVSWCASPAGAAVLWYNGDYDNRDSLTNQSKVPINTGAGYVLQKSLVYDNFVVPAGQTWTISSVFSNVQMAYYVAPTTATWEIRTGVVAGNGGTVVASGDTAATATAVTPNGSFYYGDPEYKISATVTGVALTAGTYWLAVAPDSAGYYGDQSYIETTSGASSVGTPPGNDGNSFINSNYPTSGPGTYNFTSAGSVLTGEGKIDFSMGVNGTSVSVPEPSSLALVVAGLCGLSVMLRRVKPRSL